MTETGESGLDLDWSEEGDCGEVQFQETRRKLNHDEVKE